MKKHKPKQSGGSLLRGVQSHRQKKLYHRPSAKAERGEPEPAKPRVVIVVEGGVVTKVFSSADIEVSIKDWDDIDYGSGYRGFDGGSNGRAVIVSAKELDNIAEPIPPHDDKV